MTSKRCSWRQNGRRLAALALAWSLAGCAQSLFYQPDHVLYDTPQRLKLSYEAVRFRSADGTELSGWFIPARGYAQPRLAKGTVIHLHGNAQNMTAHWQFVDWLPDRGYNLFVFDYRGYGASAGKPDVRGVFDDANSALNYVRARPDVDPERLIVFGQSLGGANAIAIVGSGNRAGVKALLVEATFFSYSAIANDKLPGAGLLMDDSYSPERYIAAVAPIPFLLLHGAADEVIPYAHAGRLMAKAGAPKQLLTVPDGGHIAALTPQYGDLYRNALAQFMASALADKREAP